MSRIHVLSLFVVSLTACASFDTFMGRQPARAASTSSVSTPAPEPTAAFPAIHRAVDDADALVATDPAAADIRYVHARAALLKQWGEQRGGDMPSNRLMRAFGHIDEQTEGSEAAELMWRTFLGRARALAARHRDEEAVGELPDYEFARTQCPSALAAACVAHVEHLRRAFADAVHEEGGQVFGVLAWRVEQDPDALDTQRALQELPKLQRELAHQGWVLIKMPASSATRDRRGRIQLELKGVGIGVRTGENCKKYLKQELVDDHIVVEERCDNVQHETIKVNDLSVDARAAIDLPELHRGDIYTLAVPGSKLTAQGHRYRFPDAVILKVENEHGPRYKFNANLDWSLPAPRDITPRGGHPRAAAR